MISSNTDYCFYEIFVPDRPRYKHAEHGWPNIVGDYIKVLFEPYQDDKVIYWFLQEGTWFQICFASKDKNKEIEKRIASLNRKLKFKNKKIIRGKLGTALGGPRWVKPAHFSTLFESNRSFLLADSLHKICKLYLNLLEKDDVYGVWKVETNTDTKQNVYGNIFESYMHLIANITQAKFPLDIYVRTPWMGTLGSGRIPCHL